ncbi:MAG: hypothetical protein WBQ26_15670 [Gemmatimonadaceae bacterium]
MSPTEHASPWRKSAGQVRHGGDDAEGGQARPAHDEVVTEPPVTAARAHAGLHDLVSASRPDGQVRIVVLRD